MELIFSYTSGLGDALDKPVSNLNYSAKLFFKDKSYAESIERIMFILVTKNLTDFEEKAFKVKHTKTDSAIAINFYLKNSIFLNEKEKDRISYIANIVTSALKKNKRLGNLEIDLDKLVIDLDLFFKSKLETM